MHLGTITIHRTYHLNSMLLFLKILCVLRTITILKKKYIFTYTNLYEFSIFFRRSQVSILVYMYTQVNFIHLVIVKTKKKVRLIKK